MGFIITTEYTFPNELKATDLLVTIYGTYNLVKAGAPTAMPMPMMAGPFGAPSSGYTITYTYAVYKVRTIPVETKTDSFSLETVDGVNIYAEIYTRVKAKFPGMAFTNN